MSVLSRDTEKSELEHEPRRRNKLAMPDVFVILFGFLIIAFIMTYVIPPGTFERVDKDGITQVVPDSFQYINAGPLSIMDLFSAVQKGLVNAAGIIFIILIAGGVIRTIEYTGAIDSGVNALLRKSRGRQNVLIVTFCSIFAVICSMGVAPNLAVAFVPIGLLLARKLGLDPVMGVAMVLLGAYSGFAGGVFDPVVTVMGQMIAGLPIFSGALFRVVIFFAFVIVTILYITLYAKKLRLSSDAASNSEEAADEEAVEMHLFTRVHQVVILLFFVAIGSFLYGSLQRDWSINELSAIFLMLGIVIALVTRMSPNQFVKVFMEGAGRVMYGALAVGVAGAVIVVLQDGQVVDTIVHEVASALNQLTPVLSMVLLYVFNLLFNGIVSSGAGQAAIVMPVMVPIGDVLEVTRQSVFITFKLGDAVTNVITPLSGTLMACLAIAKVSYVKWVKFVWPLLLIWIVLGGLFVAAAVLINYGPF